jgi:hypothetical protein
VIVVARGLLLDRHATGTSEFVIRSKRTVMKTLGHSQNGLTMNTYTHVLPEIERADVDSAAEAIFGGGHAGVNRAP